MLCRSSLVVFFGCLIDGFITNYLDIAVRTLIILDYNNERVDIFIVLSANSSNLPSAGWNILLCEFHLFSIIYISF